MVCLGKQEVGMRYRFDLVGELLCSKYGFLKKTRHKNTHSKILQTNSSSGTSSGTPTWKIDYCARRYRRFDERRFHCMYLP
jgi:hypothetical protein